MRVILPVLLLAAGIAALTYGSAFNRNPVSFEEEIVPATPPPPPVPPMFAHPPGPGGPRGPRPPFNAFPKPPPPRSVIVMRTIEEPEHRIVLEATRGGVTRQDGRIVRTYSGAPPSGCPT
jgi:hypothetical protein